MKPELVADVREAVENALSQGTGPRMTEDERQCELKFSHATVLLDFVFIGPLRQNDLLNDLLLQLRTTNAFPAICELANAMPTMHPKC